METDRSRNDKVRCAVIDTNVLMYSYLFRVDVFSELKLLGFNRFLVPSGVVEELKILRDKLGGKYSRAAMFALKLVERECEVVELDVIGTDRALMELCVREGCTLITNDRELRKKARKAGLSVGYVREMNRVFVEGLEC